MNDYELLIKKIASGDEDFDISQIVADFMLIRDGEAFSELLQENSGEIATYVRQYAESFYKAPAITTGAFEFIIHRIIAQAKSDIAECRWQAADGESDDYAEEKRIDDADRAKDMNSINRSI